MEKENKSKHTKLLEKAWKKFHEKDYAGAEADFTELIEKTNDSYALYARACAFFKLKEFENSLNDLNQFIKKQPKSYKGYHLRGIVKGSLNKPNDALKDIERSVKINPEYVEGYYDLGGCYLMLDEYQKAYDCFERCLTRDNSNAGAWFGKGMSSLMNKEYHKSIEYFTIAIKLNKKFLLAILARCDAYFTTGQKKEAIKDFNKAKNITPDILEFKKQYYSEPNYHKNEEDEFDGNNEIEDFSFDE